MRDFPFLWYVSQGFQNFPFYLVNMWACEPKGILSRYFTGIIYYASQCWQSYAIVFLMQQNSFAKFVVDSVSLAQWQAQLKEGGRNQGSTFFPPYLFLHVFDLYLLALMWHVRLRVGLLLTVKWAMSQLLKSSVTWQAQKWTKEPWLIYSWLTNLCKHSPTT